MIEWHIWGAIQIHGTLDNILMYFVSVRDGNPFLVWHNYIICMFKLFLYLGILKLFAKKLCKREHVYILNTVFQQEKPLEIKASPLQEHPMGVISKQLSRIK